MQTVEKPTDKEILNSKIILDMLSKIDGLSFTQQTKEDIFVVSEEETDLSCVVDVEEDIVSVIMNVAEFEGDLPQTTAGLLLSLNNSALFGAFSVEGNKILFKNNLDIENLDLNELQSTLTSVFLTVSQNLEAIGDSLN